MPAEARKRQIDYIGGKGLTPMNLAVFEANKENQRKAADEYIAELAEQGVTAENKSVWEKIKQFIQDFFRSNDIPAEVTDDDIVHLLENSKKRLEMEGNIIQECPSSS